VHEIFAHIYTDTAGLPCISSATFDSLAQRLRTITTICKCMRNKAFSIEADVYPGDSLPVAHDKKKYHSGQNTGGDVPAADYRAI